MFSSPCPSCSSCWKDTSLTFRSSSLEIRSSAASRWDASCDFCRSRAQLCSDRLETFTSISWIISWTWRRNPFCLVSSGFVGFFSVALLSQLWRWFVLASSHRPFVDLWVQTNILNPWATNSSKSFSCISSEPGVQDATPKHTPCLFYPQGQFIFGVCLDRRSSGVCFSIAAEQNAWAEAGNVFLKVSVGL